MVRLYLEKLGFRLPPSAEVEALAELLPVVILQALQSISDADWDCTGRHNVNHAGKNVAQQMTLGLLPTAHRFRCIPMPTKCTYTYQYLCAILLQ